MRILLGLLPGQSLLNGCRGSGSTFLRQEPDLVAHIGTEPEARGPFSCRKWLKAIALGLLLFIYLQPLAGQVPLDSFVDPRDGQAYAMVQVDDLWWMHDNLRLGTPGSFCPYYTEEDSECKDGNFYPYQELDELCPSDWRLATLADFEAYFDYILRLREITRDSLEVRTLDDSKHGKMISDLNERVRLFDLPNLINLQPMGWVQGKRRQRPGTITLWADHPSEDRRFHLHIGPNSYVGHSHAHHIDDKKKRRRRFLVRCVRD